MINRILMFLSILFMINITLIGTGVYEIALLDSEQYTILSKGLEDIDDLSTPTELDTVDVGESDSVVDSESQLNLIPEVTRAYSGMKTILKLAGGLVFGWSAIFVELRFPALLAYGLTMLIGLIQLFSVFYIIAYFISALRGGI